MLRCKMLFSFSLGGTGLLAAIAGFIQYFQHGSVAIRPGQTGIEGEAALEMLTVLTVISLFCLAYGMLLRRRSNP